MTPIVWPPSAADDLARRAIWAEKELKILDPNGELAPVAANLIERVLSTARVMASRECEEHIAAGGHKQ